MEEEAAEMKELCKRFLQDKVKLKIRLQDYFRSAGGTKLDPTEFQSKEIQKEAQTLNKWFHCNFATAFHILVESRTKERPLLAAMLDIKSTFSTMFLREIKEDNVVVLTDEHGHPFVRVVVSFMK